MSARLSEQRLAEILARASAATEGPWCTASWEIYQGTEYVPGMSFWIGETCRGTADLAQDAADAAFVAAARTDVPELVAEVQFLRAQVAGLEQQADQLHNDVTGACLARWEEEQDAARLRLAWKSARRGRRKAREQVHELTPYEQLFLKFALELAADQMANQGDEFDAADDAALESLRRLTGEAPRG